MRRPHRSAPRGGAAVELAALMVMLVPLVMYTLYLEDLLFYKLDQEETVVSAPWDFYHHDYRHRPAAQVSGEVTRLTGQIYWDHTSAWNTYSNPKIDGSDTRHHQALTAHQCWLTQGAQQLACSWDTRKLGWGAETDPDFAALANGYSGMVASCSARLGVQNYFLPEKFLGHAVAYSQRFTSAPGGKDIHANAKKDNWLFPTESAAVMHDPWALSWLKQNDDITAAGNHPMALLDPSNHPQNQQSEWYDWVSDTYGRTMGQEGRARTVKDFAQGLVSDFLTAAALGDSSGDDIGTPPQAYKDDPTSGFNDFQPSGYADQRVKSTYGGREKAYLGLRDQAW